MTLRRSSVSHGPLPVAPQLSWRRCLEPWLLPYALVGVSTGGLVSILLPLAATRAGSAAHVGLVMSAISMGLLTAPLWGGLADRLRLHRLLFIGGAALAAGALALLALDPPQAVWLPLALLIGVGMTAVNTVANLFVVEAHPKPEWDQRFGWVQAVYGGGIALGLLVASWLTSSPLRIGMPVAAGVTAVAAVVAVLTARTPPRPDGPPPATLHLVSPRSVAHGLARMRSLECGMRNRDADVWLHLFRIPHSAFRIRDSAFGLFLLAWTFSNLGLAAVYALYPLVMRDTFEVSARISSLAYSGAMVLGLTLYTASGRWSARYGALRVLQLSLAARLVAVAALAALGVTDLAGRGPLALGLFTLVSLAFSPLAVSSSALASSLTTTGEGASMGVYNAASALAELLGAAVGGWLAHRLGYDAVLWFAAAGLAAGVPLSLVVQSRGSRIHHGGTEARRGTSE